MARWGLVIVAIYAAVALITPALMALGLLPDANAGLSNPIYDCLLYTSDAADE